MDNQKQEKTNTLAIVSAILFLISLSILVTFYWCDLFSDQGAFLCSLCLFDDPRMCFDTNKTSSYAILNLYFIVSLIPALASLFIGAKSLSQIRKNNHKGKRIAMTVTVLSLLIPLLCYLLYDVLPHFIFVGF